MLKPSYIKAAIFLFIVCYPFRATALSYEHISEGYFTSIHVLTVSPSEHTIIPVKSMEGEVNRETVSSLAKRYNAYAAINGGFWKLDGRPAGALKIDGQWLGTPIKPRGAIGWSTINHKALIDRILTDYSITECPPEYQVSVIPASTPSYTSPEEWEQLEHVVGGAPVLVQNGHLIEDFSSEQTLESFLVQRHPRTAVGIKGNGDWIFVVVDGRFYELFGGMTMNELARLMLDLGCIEALNLDGGGSSTMVIEGKVVNDPCGEIEEDGKRVTAVSDAILIF